VLYHLSHATSPSSFSLIIIFYLKYIPWKTENFEEGISNYSIKHLANTVTSHFAVRVSCHLDFPCIDF
jgi:hypothetical protein